MEAAFTSPDPVNDEESLEETHCSLPKKEPAKDCRRGSKAKSLMDRQSLKGAVSSEAPRITIKLVAKKKVKTVKDPNSKSAKKLNVKGRETQPTTKDIQGDQISSAHVKLKSEVNEENHDAEDPKGELIPARRRGRSALRAKPARETGAKGADDDQKLNEAKSADQLDVVKDNVSALPKTNLKKSKEKEKVAEQTPDANQLMTRRSNRVTNPLSKKVADSVTDPESLSKNEEVLAEPEVCGTVTSVPSARSNRRRQSRRLNKNIATSENPLCSETEVVGVKSESRVPSLKLKKIRNPKYDAWVSGKYTTRKKKVKKHLWTLTVKEGDTVTPCTEIPIKVMEEPVGEADQPTSVDTSVKESQKTVDATSRLDSVSLQESKILDNSEKCSRRKACLEKSLEEASPLPAKVDVEHVNETAPQETSKSDCGKVVPPLQIKKVSSPGKHKSSKPSFLIQQVSPVSEKTDSAVKDQGEGNEDKSPSLDAEVTPSRRLRRRTLSSDSPQTQSVSPKPVASQRRRLKLNLPCEEAPPVQVEETLPALTEDTSSLGLPELPSQDFTEEPSQLTSVTSSEVPVSDSTKVTDDLPQVSEQVLPQEEKKEEELQVTEAKPTTVPSKPKRCKNNKFGKKKPSHKKKVVVPPETVISKDFSAADTAVAEPKPREDAQPLDTEGTQPETQDCAQPEAKQDSVPVEEEQIQISPVKEETDIQLIDFQQPVLSESPTSDPKAVCLQTKSPKKLKKRRKNLIGQRQKHRHRSRDGKFAPLKSSEDSPDAAEEDGSVSTSLETPELSPRLTGVQKKYSKQPSGLQLLASKKPEGKIISQLIEIGLEQESLKQEETDTSVEVEQPDAVSQHPSKAKFVKNIKHFIMPVVSARSSRVIKTPQRFMDDIGMSVLPRRSSPKKGLQLGLQVRSHKKRDDGMGRAISPILPVGGEDILSEDQLDVDLFSAHDLDDTIDLADSLFSDDKAADEKKSHVKNSAFRWHLPEQPNDEEIVEALGASPQSKCEDLFLPSLIDKPTEPPANLLEAQKPRESFPKFKKQTAHLKIFQRLKKANAGLTGCRAEVDGASRPPPPPPVDLAEGLDDEAMSISLRQRNTDTEKDKSKLKIEDLDSPGVVRKVAVCVRGSNSKPLLLHGCRGEGLAGRGPAPPKPGNYSNSAADNLGRLGNGFMRPGCVTHLFHFTEGLQLLPPLPQKAGRGQVENLTAAAEKGASQRGRLTGANKRMLNLLRKAKVQLIKIDQQKQLKSSGVSAGVPFLTSDPLTLSLKLCCIGQGLHLTLSMCSKPIAKAG